MRGNTIRATAQMRLFNLSCKANVILLLVTAIVAAGVALYSYMRSVDKVKVAMVNFNLEHARTAAAIKKQNKEIQKSVNDSTAEEITKIKLLQKQYMTPLSHIISEKSHSRYAGYCSWLSCYNFKRR